jgi:ATP-binding cassette subfamily F protein 3
MLINLSNISKTLGAKQLYRGLDFTVQPGEKVGLIGRNGVGKTTLFGIMSGADSDYNGQIDRRRGVVVVSTLQEHADHLDKTVMEYVLGELPEYTKLKHIIDTHPETMGEDMKKIEEYTQALDRFGELGYFDIEAEVTEELIGYGLPAELVEGPLRNLSGGQKRFVELAKVTVAQADLALIDEPTNHMDYVAKATFIKWLQKTDLAVVVITHDRDVLHVVDRIAELKEHGAASFRGNYDAYLKQNSMSTTQAITDYEAAQKRIVKLDKQIAAARAKKAGWSGTADKTNPFMLLERRLMKEKDELLTNMKKPDFWIDQESVNQLQDRMVQKYDRYKAKNIRLGMSGSHRFRQLVKVSELSLGYEKPLFDGINFELSVGDRLRLHGRNGAGKSTLLKFLIAQAASQKPVCRKFEGEVVLDPKLSIGTYEQEVEPELLAVPLGDAITRVYQAADQPISDQKVRQVLSDYLFDPRQDLNLKIGQLSGGQKARFQMIAMLASDPNLLILDEPTNHLDLPSIEELEKALAKYEGAVLFVSHDSYFSRNVGGETVKIGN